jgi:hypothetical protein
VKQAFYGSLFSPQVYPGGLLALFEFVFTKCPDNNNDREECLRFLDHMNINRASLFPDLDGAARYVNDLWEVNFDKAIGHIGDE